MVISAVSFYELLFGAGEGRRSAQVEALAEDYAVLPADYTVCAITATTGRFPVGWKETL
ncbi:MAG: type II toxin-antitoxin system VapC family toxin [Candidatus Methylomirabilales bacterium]